MHTLSELNTRINKFINNPQIAFFIIMSIILLITCYSFIASPIRTTLSTILSNPVVILFAMVSIIILGYFNINIAILLLILFFLALYGIDNSSKTEYFTTKNMQAKEENDKKIDEKVNNIKNVVLSTINKFRDDSNNDYKNAILENKQNIYKEEKHNNKRKQNLSSKESNKVKDNFNDVQTIQYRTFDPSNEEDTNFLITKEILQDIVNRIEYNYESSKYLKKYIKHRIEEIVEINKLVDDD